LYQGDFDYTLEYGEDIEEIENVEETNIVLPYIDDTLHPGIEDDMSSTISLLHVDNEPEPNPDRKVLSALRKLETSYNPAVSQYLRDKTPDPLVISETVEDDTIPTVESPDLGRVVTILIDPGNHEPALTAMVVNKQIFNDANPFKSLRSKAYGLVMTTLAQDYDKVDPVK